MDIEFPFRCFFCIEMIMVFFFKCVYMVYYIVLNVKTTPHSSDTPFLYIDGLSFLQDLIY